MQKDYSLREELGKLWRYKWYLAGAVGLAAVVALAFVFLTPSRYASAAEFVPPKLDKVKSLNFSKVGYEGFGSAEDKDLERLSAVLKGDSAYYFMVQKFDLAARYGLADVSDEESKYRRLREKFDDRVSIGVTGLSTVRITVEDTDPEFAARLANEYLAYADTFVESLARRRAAVEALKVGIARFDSTVGAYKDSLSLYRAQNKLYRLNELSETVSREILNSAFSRPGFAERYDQMLSAESRVYLFDVVVADMHEELQFRLANLKAYPTMLDVVSRAMPSKVIAYPKKLATVALSALFSFVAAALLILTFGKPAKA